MNGKKYIIIVLVLIIVCTSIIFLTNSYYEKSVNIFSDTKTQSLTGNIISYDGEVSKTIINGKEIINNNDDYQLQKELVCVYENVSVEVFNPYTEIVEYHCPGKIVNNTKTGIVECYEPNNKTIFTNINPLTIKGQNFTINITGERMSKEHVINKLCEETGGYTINNSKNSYYCNAKSWGRCSQASKKTVMCDSRYDGNGDGICQSGESCITIDLTNKIGGVYSTESLLLKNKNVICTKN